MVITLDFQSKDESSILSSRSVDFYRNLAIIIFSLMEKGVKV